MKVTLAANHGEIGGGEVMLLAIARALREGGHEVSVVTPAEPDEVARAAMSEGLPATTIHGRGTVDYLWGLRRWDSRQRDGLLWCNGLRPALATAGHGNRIVHLHQEPHGSQVFAARLASWRARRVLLPSHSLSGKVPGSTALENWTEPLPSSQRTRQPGEPFVLGFLGRPSVDKGVVALAQALTLIEQRHPEMYRLLLAGEPRFVSPKAEHEVEMALAPIRHLVDRPGWVNREDFFNSVDLLVVPSIAPESFGLVVAEAMAAEVPFVISDAGALPEVAGAEYPWVARAGRPDELADVVVRAATDPGAPALTARSLARWREHYSPESGARRIAKLMSALSREI